MSVEQIELPEREQLAPHPVLTEIVGRLVEAFQPERIYLFGSQARGDVGPDSDYDLMVVVPNDAPPERRQSSLAYECLWGTGMAADVLVWTKTSFDCRILNRVIACSSCASSRTTVASCPRMPGSGSRSARVAGSSTTLSRRSVSDSQCR